MSLYSLSNSAPINNVGYYDGNYFNQQQNNQHYQIPNQQFNHHIADNYNTNNKYEVYPSQNYPSSTLFLEDFSNDYGYVNNNGQHNGAIINRPHNNRNTMNHPSEIYSMENFENNNPDMEMTRNANRLDKIKSTKENPRISNNIHRHSNHQFQQHNQPQHHHIINNNNQYIPRQPTVQYNDYHYNNSPDYLNVGSIPNIAGLYNNVNRPIEKIIVKEVNNDRETKITDLDDDDDEINDSVDDSKETKISNLKKKINKKKKVKKKKDNMIYLIIFLLIIIIGLILYIVMNQKVKRVRF